MFVQKRVKKKKLFPLNGNWWNTLLTSKNIYIECRCYFMFFFINKTQGHSTLYWKCYQRRNLVCCQSLQSHTGKSPGTCTSPLTRIGDWMRGEDGYFSGRLSGLVCSWSKVGTTTSLESTLLMHFEMVLFSFAFTTWTECISIGIDPNQLSF